ncbi:MAG: hypothetical protein K5864_08040 [Bacteroidales bacterium]|nr:hypothetical protein [Bacteroidales bacterium]
MRKVILTLTALSCIGMMTGCKSATEYGNTTENTMLLGKWKCVAAECRWWAEEDEYDLRFEPTNYKQDTSIATLVSLNFIDTSKCVVTYHTHDCEPQLPYLINVDSTQYSKSDIRIEIEKYGHNKPTEFETEKLTRDTLVLRCFESDEGERYQMRYTFVKE